MKNVLEQATVPPMPNKEMSADKMLELFIELRPQLFDHIYKECKLVFNSRMNYEDYVKVDDSQVDYWANEELNIARAIVYDYGNKMANKIGRIIVSSTE